MTNEAVKVKCPKCGAMIDYLNNYTPGWNRYIFDGEYSYSEFIIDDSKDDDFSCPNCEAPLFSNESHALAFLRGMDAPKVKQ